MLPRCLALISPLSPILVQLWTAWEALLMSPHLRLPLLLPPPLPFYFLAALSNVFLFYCCRFLSCNLSCHLLIRKPFLFSFPFTKPPPPFPSLHPHSGTASQTHAALDEKQPLTWGPKRPQHLNSLFFLPPPFFAGHEWHCQMLALINLIIRWATLMQARVLLA